MSTKIWTAWRMPVRRLNEYLDIVRPHMFAEALRDVKALADAVKPEIVEQEMARYHDGRMAFSRTATERAIRVEAVLKMASDDRFRESILSFDCGLNVWLDGRFAYVIPWGGPKYYSDLAFPAWAEDYHYQNSTDKPDDISDRAWQRRAATWDRVALDDWNAHRLTYTVVSMDCQSMSSANITLHFLRLARQEREAATPGAGSAGEA